LSTFLLVRRKWLAVIAPVCKILPNVGRKLPERVAKLVEATVGDRQISLRVEIVPLQNLVTTCVLPIRPISVPKMPDNSRHESDGSPTDSLNVGLAIVAKVPRLPLYVVRPGTRHRFEKRSVAAAADISIVDATNASQPLHGRNPSPSRCRVVNYASALPRRRAAGSIFDLSAVAIVVCHRVE
jgi:hypothetical protein